MSSLPNFPFRNRYMRLLFIIFSVGVAFGSGLNSSFVKNSHSGNQQEEIRANDIRSVTLIDYERLREGMNLTDVRAILGSYGTELEQAGKDVTFSWKNADGSNITVIFYNGVLKYKSQFLLK